MILLLDTSTPICRVRFVESDFVKDYEWTAGRELARGLLKYLFDLLAENNKKWSNISAIGVFRGPGSFTGLRIGMTVANTLADGLNVPIVGGSGRFWQDEVILKIKQGENEKIILPFYGSEANITKPKK